MLKIAHKKQCALNYLEYDYTTCYTAVWINGEH